MGIKAGQTLHGYAKGHGLLRSSIRLSKESERLMLGMSDMSGPGMRTGFDSYLTAYPLPAEQAYVIARTWYASEMPRPGCVWTHSLVFIGSEIDKVADGRSLMRVFRRPDSLALSNAYAAPLDVDQGDGELFSVAEPGDASHPRDDQLLRAALCSLYGQPDKPVFIVAPNVGEQELLIIDLWSQQWPGLRRSFSFCTGALSNRQLEGKSLDLQVVPSKAFSELRQELAQGVVINSTSPLSPDDRCDQKWIDEAMLDLSPDSDRSKRRIAWSIAANRVADRSSFPAVFRLAAVVQERRTMKLTARDYVKAIAKIPAELRIPTSLYKSVLSAPDDTDSELDLLEALSTIPVGDLMKPDDLEIADRIDRLWKANKRTALNLLLYLIAQETVTEIGSQVLRGICKAMKPDDISEIGFGLPGYWVC